MKGCEATYTKTFSPVLQVHRCSHPSELQQEACGHASDGAAVGHLGRGAGRGVARRVRHQQRAGPRPHRVQTGERRLRAVLVRVLLLHPVSHHAAAVLRHVSRPEAMGRSSESQAEEQYSGLPKASRSGRRAAGARRSAAITAARHQRWEVVEYKYLVTT